MGRGALVGYSPWGLKELDTTERLMHKHNEQLTTGTSLFVTRSWKRPLVPVLPSLGKHSFN